MKPLSLIFPYENLHGICGALRALLAVADVCKAMGHEATVLGDPDGAKPGPDDSVKVLRHYELDGLGEYYPLKALNAGDWDESTRLLGLKAWDRYSSADIVWSFSAIYDRVEDHCERPDMNAPPTTRLLRNHWSYQHWPVSGDYPHATCTQYANSTYTQEAVKARWGHDSHLLHPPIPLDAYDPSPGYAERDTDVIYIGRVDPLKLGRPPVLERFRDLKTLIVGANNEASFPDYHPNIEWLKNATINQLAGALSHAKVYVHWKGLLDRSGWEHFGITVGEAMASGVPTIVPRGGGAWLDIADKGKYCIGISSVEEGIREATRLCMDRQYWEEWHLKAVEGVQRFGYDVAAEKLAKWLGEVK